MRKSIAVCASLPVLLALLCASTVHGQALPSDPDEALSQGRLGVKEGVSLLKKAREGDGDSAKLSRQALKLFERAQQLYEFYVEKRGENPKIEDEMSDLQSLIYWSRKMTPLADEERVKEEKKAEKEKPKVNPERDCPGGENVPAPAPPPPEVKPRQETDTEQKARALFEQAQRFEREHPKDFFAISARYFEVVDRYRGSSVAGQALEKCMEYQRRLMTRSTPGKKPVEQPVKKAEYVAPTDPTLIRLNLRHPKLEVRKKNIEALVKARGKKALPELHAMFEEEEDDKVLEALIQVIAGLKDSSTIKFAKKRCLYRDSALGAKLIRLVSALGRADGVKIILAVLAVNTKAPVASGHPLQTHEFVKTYASQVESAFAQGLRSRGVEALRTMGSTGEKGLRKLIKGRSLITREAILCSGMLKAHKNAGVITVYLQRNNRYAFRSEAMAALCIIGIDAVPYLIKNLGGPLRIWSAYQLREMTGERWTASAAKRWWAWYHRNKGR